MLSGMKGYFRKRNDVKDLRDSNKKGDRSLVASIGFCEEANTRWRKQMEDAHVIANNFRGVKTDAFFAVYDGHGGRAAVDVVKTQLHKFFAEELNQQGATLDPSQAFVEAYRRTDGLLLEDKCLYVGTTAVTCFLTREGESKKLYVANCGDARAVLCREGKPLRLSYDHKASDEAEAQRICDGGGQVVAKRVNGILSVSRALGDHAMKNVVLSVPHTVEENVLPEDSFLLLACDGLWDVMEDEEAIKFVEEGLANGSDMQTLTRNLVQAALSGGSTDNLSVMLIQFPGGS